MQPRRLKAPAKSSHDHHSATSGVPLALLKQARRSGQLNLSGRGLKAIPDAVWRVNCDPGADATSFDTDDKWWDQTELVKLILASNELTELSEDIALLPALNALDVHNNQLIKLPVAIGDLKQLTRLMLSYNQLEDLGEGLRNLVNLQYLRLDHNCLRYLHDNMSSLVHLEQLDVSHNQLSKLPVSLGAIRSLRKLNLDHNQLTELPPGMKGLQELTAGYNKISTVAKFTQCLNLERFDLRNNFIPEFPVILPGTKVKEVFLGGNRITTIPGDRLVPLVALVTLDLRDNKILCVPDQISSVNSLERLDLTNNDITSLPHVMGKLSNLKLLSLDGNPMKSIRRDIIKKGTLEIVKYLKSRLVEGDDSTCDNTSPPIAPPGDKLVYSGKKASFVPEEFWDHPNPTTVSFIDISRNQLTSLPDKLMVFSSTHELLLSFNKLPELSRKLGGFVHLTSLDLRSNQLTDLPTEISACHQLREIFLSMNKFTMLPDVLYTLKQLENIFASDNQITDINVAGLLQLPMISCLDLQNNDISSVPPHLGNLSSLKSLQLNGNPFRQPRPNILARGTPALLEYLRDRIPK